MRVAERRLVDVEVDQTWTGDGVLDREAELLGRLALRGDGRCLAGVDVAAGLHPDAEPLVEVQHRAAPADDDARRRDVGRVRRARRTATLSRASSDRKRSRAAASRGDAGSWLSTSARSSSVEAPMAGLLSTAGPVSTVVACPAMRTRVAVGTHVEQRAAPRELAGHEGVASQLGRPVRPRRALGRAGGRVLVDAHVGPEDAQHVVGTGTGWRRRGEQQRLGPGGGDRSQVGHVGAPTPSAEERTTKVKN